MAAAGGAGCGGTASEAGGSCGGITAGTAGMGGGGTAGAACIAASCCGTAGTSPGSGRGSTAGGSAASRGCCGSCCNGWNPPSRSAICCGLGCAAGAATAGAAAGCCGPGRSISLRGGTAGAGGAAPCCTGETLRSITWPPGAAGTAGTAAAGACHCCCWACLTSALMAPSCCQPPSGRRWTATSERTGTSSRPSSSMKACAKPEGSALDVWHEHPQAGTGHTSLCCMCTAPNECWRSVHRLEGPDALRPSPPIAPSSSAGRLRACAGTADCRSTARGTHRRWVH